MKSLHMKCTSWKMCDEKSLWILGRLVDGNAPGFNSCDPCRNRPALEANGPCPKASLSDLFQNLSTWRDVFSNPLSMVWTTTILPSRGRCIGGRSRSDTV